jgi:hypothetical protein
MANTYLTRTFGTPTNNLKWTFSAWIKKSGFDGNQALLSSGADANNRGLIYLADNGRLFLYETTSGTDTTEIGTNRLFRDVSAWYHIVVAVDTSQGTEANRVKIYVNGTQETSISPSNYPSVNAANFINSAVRHDISGRNNHSSSDLYFNGLMSHIHLIDGTAYDATAFGETDATTGEWVGKTSPSVTYGNNGFFILKDGNGITDQSGEGNDFTLGGGTLTDLKDNPDNNFATLNPLNSWGNTVLTNGNLTAGNTGTSGGHVSSTMHMNKGKWYMEFNVDTHLSGYSAPMFFLAGTGAFQQQETTFSASGDGAFGIASNGRSITDGQESSSVVFPVLVNNDKVQIAYDADAGKAWFGINGTYLNSGNPTTAANPYFTSTKLQNNDVSFKSIGYDGNAMSANFGNGYFGTTAITTNSGNGYAGAEGASKFNYTVPTGYSALSTKGLNE